MALYGKNQKYSPGNNHYIAGAAIASIGYALLKYYRKTHSSHLNMALLYLDSDMV